MFLHALHLKSGYAVTSCISSYIAPVLLLFGPAVLRGPSVYPDERQEVADIRGFRDRKS